jgi:hypothetical protein
MTQKYLCDDKTEFLAKLKELVDDGVPTSSIEVRTPVPVHEAFHILRTPPSPLGWFTGTGAVLGAAMGFGLTTYAVLAWPLITSGKPLISLPPFMIIAFELTILLGAVASILGFFHLNRFPDIRSILAPEETGNAYAIFVKEQA